MNIPILSRCFKRNHKQIVILLGAGAAYSWDERSTSETFNQRIMNKYAQNRIGSKLSEILQEFYGDNSCFNFETFLAAVEEVLNYIIASTNIGGNANSRTFTPIIFKFQKEIEELLKNKNDDQKRKCCYAIFRNFVNIVIDEVDEYNSKILKDRNKTINDNLIYFVKYCLRHNYAVKFYTTNYDNIIPQVLKQGNLKIYEGFSNISDGIEISKRFNYNLKRFRKACISHFNIHGSIFLHKSPITSRYETIYSCTGKKLLNKTAFGEYSGNPGEPLFFSPIISGYNKTQRVSNKPFNLGFGALTNDCADCKALITVGYSFSDPHINSILTNFINWKQIRYLDVNPAPKMEHKDYVPCIIPNNEDDEQWIHDITNRKHVFKATGGFADFLKDKTNWKYLFTKIWNYE
jgi:hypothetical protein